MIRPVTAGPRFADNGGVRLAFEDLGGPGGDPLLLVMGLGASRFWWPSGFVTVLADRGFHVAAFDLRDAGQSSHLTQAGGGSPLAGLLTGRPAPYTAEDMTDDAVEVLDALGWESAHVFGHSLGGLLAQRIALRHRGRVRSLTSSSALPSDVSALGVARYVRPGFLARTARMRFPEGPDGDLQLGVALYRAIAAPGYPLDEATAGECVQRDIAHGCGLRDRAAQARQSSARWSGGRLAELDIRALVLHGQQDQVLRPSAARHTSAAVTNARLRLLPGMGHFIPRELWAVYADEMRAVADTA